MFWGTRLGLGTPRAFYFFKKIPLFTTPSNPILLPKKALPKCFVKTNANGNSYTFEYPLLVLSTETKLKINIDKENLGIKLIKRKRKTKEKENENERKNYRQSVRVQQRIIAGGICGRHGEP